MFEEEFIHNKNRNESKLDSSLAVGTFTIHNLGMFGIRSAAPIVLPPQACAIAFGAVQDSVIPNSNAKDGKIYTYSIV